jgi:uncharacterized membrane protein
MMKGEGESMSRSVVTDAYLPSVFSDLIDLACIAIATIMVLSVALNSQNAVRAVAAVIFALFVPGRAVVANWPAIATRAHVAVTVLFSLTLLTLIATAALWSHFWHPLGLLVVESILSAGALIAAILRRHRALDKAPKRSALQMERDL